MNRAFGHLFTPRPLLRVGVVLTALALVIGCKKHEPTDGGAPATSGSAAPGVASAAPSATSSAPTTPAEMPDPVITGPKTEIEIVSAGSGPTKVFVYGFKKGVEKKFLLNLGIEPTVTVGNQKMPGGGSIQLAVGGKTKILEVLPNGTAERLSTFETFEPTAKELPQDAVNQLKQQLNSLGALQIKDTVNSQGKIETLMLVKAAMVPPAAQALIGNISEGMSHALFRLPSAPIGVGAEWTESGTIDSGGVSVTNVIRYKLVKVAGSKLSITLKSKQSAPAGKVNSPQLPPGASMELVSLAGAGEGTLDLDLETLSLSAKLKSNLAVDTKVAAPGSPGVMQSKTQTKVDLKVTVTD